MLYSTLHPAQNYGLVGLTANRFEVEGKGK